MAAAENAANLQLSAGFEPSDSNQTEENNQGLNDLHPDSVGGRLGSVELSNTDGERISTNEGNGSSALSKGPKYEIIENRVESTFSDKNEEVNFAPQHVNPAANCSTSSGTAIDGIAIDMSEEQTNKADSRSELAASGIATASSPDPFAFDNPALVSDEHTNQESYKSATNFSNTSISVDQNTNILGRSYSEPADAYVSHHGNGEIQTGGDIPNEQYGMFGKTNSSEPYGVEVTPDLEAPREIQLPSNEWSMIEVVPGGATNGLPYAPVESADVTLNLQQRIAQYSRNGKRTPHPIVTNEVVTDEVKTKSTLNPKYLYLGPCCQIKKTYCCCIILAVLTAFPLGLIFYFVFHRT